jgi:23S rRNA (cytidine1920-2'-O)/16S rRNA (cytidine1409-2'-O)-methyltransferase
MKRHLTILDRLIGEAYFTSDKEALSFVMAGKVTVGSVTIRSLTERCDPSLPITVRGRSIPYAAKGGLKLEKAIRDFHVNVGGRVCIDAGASAGGFSDCLLSHNAALVYAVDVGYGQLIGRLRQDARIINLEKTNISDHKLLSLIPEPDLGSVDLSYLSLRKAIPVFKAILHGRGELLCLVKPLFEIEDTHVRRTGILDPSSYQALLNGLIDNLNARDGMYINGITASPVTGNRGTLEFFLHVIFSYAAAPDLALQTDLAIEEALALTPYKKLKHAE